MARADMAESWDGESQNGLFPVRIYKAKPNQKQLMNLNLNPKVRTFELNPRLSNEASDPRLLPSPHIHAQNKSKTIKTLKSETNT
jgi:hypothetical protein